MRSAQWRQTGKPLLRIIEIAGFNKQVDDCEHVASITVFAPVLVV
jgi:hypothetical protein